MYPWPQRPAGLVDEAFGELGGGGSQSSTLSRIRRRSVFEFTCEDLHDGVTFERSCCSRRASPGDILYDPSHFVLQQLDTGLLDNLHQRIRAFHVKDAEF